MIRLSLKTKITLLITLLVLAVVGVTSWLYVTKLTQQVIQQVERTAVQVQNQIYTQVNNTLRDAERGGRGPASDSQDDLRKYVRDTLEQSAALTSLIDAGVSSPGIYEVSIVDSGGTALISSDSSLPGRPPLVRPPMKDLVGAPFLDQLRVIYGPAQAYEIAYPLGLGVPGQQVPFGEIRVAAQVGLLREQITPALRSAGWLAIVSVVLSALLAAMVGNLSLAPLGRISAQLDRISRGEFDHQPLPGADEFGQVSTKISEIGQQLQGVREIFGTLRENLDQILAGMEDGLILFTRDGRAGMVSPAVEKFLGVPAAELLGKRASEIFPAEHPLREGLILQSDRLEASAGEIVLPGAGGDARPHRIGLSVQAITEAGQNMGALVTLRDLDSLERINRQIEVSERLAALGRVTAGVAHEVKNPLNSMRLWLENLKESLPESEGTSRQAVTVLDNEIKRLDSVVKRFLDFMRAPELRLEETDLVQLVNDIGEIARPQMQRAGVQLVIRAVPVPPIHVDQGLVKQALLNLVYNAIQAMPDGGRLTMGVERRDDSIELSVADTGLGIKPEHRARIFQLFFTTRPGGSGIGLASTYKTVHMHEGTIDFESESGRGTTFRIELPLTRRAARVETAGTRAAGGVAATSTKS